MLENRNTIVCSACDICHHEKPADLMCTYVLEGDNITGADQTCWCVCEDCLPILEKVDSYYQDAKR